MKTEKSRDILLKSWPEIKLSLAREASFYLYGMKNEVTGKSALAFGDFRLKNGSWSPFYIDIRTTYSYPTVMNRFAEMLIAIIEYEILKCTRQISEVYGTKLSEEKIHRIAGVPTAGLGLAELVSTKMGIPMLYCKEKALSLPSSDQARRTLYGAGRVHGSLKKGDRVVVVDDLITTAKSKFENAIIPIEEVGGKVSHVVVIVDREQGGKEELASNGIELHSIMTVREMANSFVELRLISKAQAEKITKFIEEDRKNKGLK